MEHKGMRLRTVFLLFALIPLITGIIVLTIITTRLMTNHLEENTLEELKLAAQSLRSYYEYDLENSIELENGFVEYAPEEYIDIIYKNTGVYLTLFNENVRYMTSLRNVDGSRNEGTKADADIWKTVRGGEDYASTDVVINKVNYYVYYMPMRVKNKVVGMAFAGKPADQVNEAENKAIMLILAVSISLMAIFTLIALILARKMSEPIKEVSEKLQELSQGTTKIKLINESHIKETTILRDSLMKLKQALSDIVGNINTNAKQLTNKITITTNNAGMVANEIEQITQSMNGLANDNVNLSEHVQTINQHMHGMNTIVNDAESNVTNLKQSTTTMTDASKKASKCIDDVAQSGQLSAKAVTDIVNSINETSEAVDKISEMVKFITDIASQTNLLSLNASIEAARAGESGRSFSVVASEIGKLAQESSSSAENIRNIVSTITNLSNKCVDQAAAVNKIINEQQKLLENALSQFDTLSKEITNSVENIDGVAVITEKLGEVKNTVTNAVKELASISENTTATNQEVVATTETVNMAVNNVSIDMKNMQNLANNLKSSVSFFKIDEKSEEYIV